MQHDLRLTIFWIIHLILLGVFAVELLYILSVWFKARVPGLPDDAPRWHKFRVVTGNTLSFVFSYRIFILLHALVLDGMVHRRLLKTSPRRWLTHALVFGAWLLLGIMSTMTGFVVEILPLLGMSPSAVASIPLLGNLYHADVWWVALFNEVLGLVALTGMLLVVYRRYIQRDAQLRTIPADNIVIALLTLIAFSGFPAETFRLLANYTTAAGVFAPDPAMLPLYKLPAELYDLWNPQWGFVGYAAAQLFGKLGVSAEVWSIWRNVAFWLHFTLSTTLLFLLPFTRFFHVIMSPVVVAYNALQTEERHGAAQRTRMT